MLHFKSDHRLQSCVGPQDHQFLSIICVFLQGRRARTSGSMTPSLKLTVRTRARRMTSSSTIPETAWAETAALAQAPRSFWVADREDTWVLEARHQMTRKRRTNGGKDNQGKASSTGATGTQDGIGRGTTEEDPALWEALG